MPGYLSQKAVAINCYPDTSITAGQSKGSRFLALQDDISILTKVGLLSDFNAEQLRLIAFGSHKRSFQQGAEIFQQGQPSDGGYVVLSGQVGLFQEINGSQKTIGDYAAGSILGEMALLSKNERAGTAIAKTDCEVLKITRAVMHRVLKEYPELAAKLHNRISGSVLEFLGDLEKVQAKLETP